LAREVRPTRADPRQFQSANIILAANAFDAMPQGGIQVSHRCGRQRQAHANARARECILVVEGDARVRKLIITRA
jgi:hypothetical protein